MNNYNKKGVEILAKVNDLTGMKFNKLTVIKRVENNKRGESQWLCKCNCKEEDENEVIVVANHLKSGNTKSCGCLQKEKAIKLGKSKKKYNTYNLTGEYGIGYTFKEDEFYFDLEDYDKIKDYCWFKNIDGYIATNINYNNRFHTVKMHRLVMNCPDDMDVDHIFHDTYDNRKEFLRIVTESQNEMNQKIRINNTSGVPGVNLNKKNNKWRARIRVDNKDMHLGYFNNKEDAIKARKAGEEKYFGEFAFKDNKNI